MVVRKLGHCRHCGRVCARGAIRCRKHPSMTGKWVRPSDDALAEAWETAHRDRGRTNDGPTIVRVRVE